MLFSNTRSNWKPSQLGLNEHITIDFNVTEQTINRTQTQLLLHVEWRCLEPNGNVSHISAFVCNGSSATAIVITIQAHLTTLSTTVVSLPNAQIVSQDNSTTESYDVYEWYVPWNLNFDSECKCDECNRLVDWPECIWTYCAQSVLKSIIYYAICTRREFQMGVSLLTYHDSLARASKKSTISL